MAKTSAEGFSQFLRWLTPSEAERAKATSHRASIYAKLNESFGLYRMFETGSFKHGTGVSGKSDVDYFVSLKSDRPQLGSSSLSAVRSALKERFPSTSVHVSTPAVVLEFGGGYERVEIIPAYAKTKLDGGDMKFNIPGVIDDWLESTPEAHVKYVNACNAIPTKGAAKGLTRLVKAWKYYRAVPVSSFYLEMRASAYMAAQSYVSYPLDLYYFLKSLDDKELGPMNDPTGTTGRIYACSTDGYLEDAKSKLSRAVGRARAAKDFDKAGDIESAFAQWDLLFNDQFPSYY